VVLVIDLPRMVLLGGGVIADAPRFRTFTIVVEYQHLKLGYGSFASVQRYLVNPKGKQQVLQSFELLKVPVQKSVVFISILLDRDGPC